MTAYGSCIKSVPIQSQRETAYLRFIFSAVYNNNNKYALSVAGGTTLSQELIHIYQM